MMELSFQCTKNFNQIEVNKNIFVNVFGYENELVFPIYVSDKTFQDSMDFLLLIDDNISHYVYIKYLGRFMFRKTKNKNKKWFCRSSLQCYSRESVLIKHKEDSQSINGKQSVKLEEGIIEVENYFKQIPVPFKIYDDCECNLRSVECYKGSYTQKKYQYQVPCSFAHKIVCVDDRFTKRIVFIELKMQLINLLKHFLRSISIAEKYE